MTSNPQPKKRPWHIKTLVLCTTERAEEEGRTTLTSGGGETSDSLEKNFNPNEHEPGYMCVLHLGREPKVVYRSFSVRTPFLWQKPVIEWFENELPYRLSCKKIKIDTNQVEAIKLFSRYLLKYRKTSGIPLIMSNKSRVALKKADPVYYNEIKYLFLTDNQYNEETRAEERKLKQLNQRISVRIKNVATNSDITSLQKRIFLYLLGKDLKASHTKEPSHLLFDYDLIADEFISGLGASKKEICKALDNLKKRGIIRVTVIAQRKFFIISNNGPVDLLPAHIERENG